MKFISGIVLICFIFTGTSGRAYAKAAVFDNLRRPAAEKDNEAEEISKELILLDQRSVWKEDLKDAKKAKQIEVHQFAKEALEDIPARSTILSLGSGAGLDEVSFAKAGHTVVATDFVESAIRELNEKIKKENIKNLTTKVQDLTKPFDFPDESFDVVYSHLSLNFMKDAEIAKAIKEIYRVLKPGGRLYLIGQSVSDSTRGQGEEIEKDTIIRGGKLVHYFSKEYIKERFAGFEFKDEDIATGERIFYPPEGRVIGFIQLKAKKLATALARPTFKGASLKELLTIIPKDFTPEYVFFDIEGTLIDAEAVAKLYIKVAQKHGVTLSLDYILKYIGGAVKFLDPEEAIEIFSEFRTDKEAVRLITEDFHQILENAANTDYFKDFLYEEVKEVFDYLKKRRIKIGIVTNRYEQLALKHMESLGLLEYLAQDPGFKRTKGYAVLGGDSTKLFQKEGLSSNLKGKGALLELATKIFDIKTSKACLMVGDMEADIKSAASVNMPSFLVTRKDMNWEILEKEKMASALEERNKKNMSNFPADILKEDKILFDRLKALKMPIYSKQDQTIYVWDNDGVEAALEEQYKQGKNDEAMISIIPIGEDGLPKSRLAEGGSIWNFAYREDRQRQFADEVLKKFPNLSMFAMTQYVPGLPMDRVVLPDKVVENSLPELLSKNDIPLIWVLDAEKSGLTLPAFRGRKTPFPNEDLQYASISMPVLMTDEQVRSGKFKPDLILQLEDKYIAWFYKGVPEGLKQIPNNEYWKYPGLSAFAVTFANIRKIKQYDSGYIYTNISLPDLIGHVAIKNVDKKAKLYIQKKDGTFEIKEGNGWDSVKACLNISDVCIQMIIEALKEKKGKMVLLGDHGSVDDMSQPNHSFNSVPIFVIDTENEEVKIIKGTGTQADAEATVAHFLDIEKPAQKTGKSLLPKDYVGNKDAIVLTNLLDGFGHTDFDDPMNAFGVAMKEGLMPTIKGLYDKNNYQLLEASGYLAGLRGGRQKDFSREDIITTRDEMLKRIEEIKPQAIQIILYDYQDIKGAVSGDYDYSSGLYELRNSPFLNDKDFVVVNDSATNKVKVLCLDYPQMGSTEYNTWTIGAMEIVEQSVVLLDKLFISGEIFKTEAAKTFLQNAKRDGEAHFSGILQEAAVHSSVRHLYYLIQYLKENGVKRFVFHLGSDGRDEGKQDCLKRVRHLRAALKYLEINDYDLDIRGRELCFDRANNMELTDAYINELLYGSRISKDKNAVKDVEDTALASKVVDKSD